jgi:hypothetical protein
MPKSSDVLAYDLSERHGEFLRTFVYIPLGIYQLKCRMKTFLMLCCAFLIGCASSSSLSDLDIGMNKHAVKKEMGNPLVRGAITNKYGQVVEVWEYDLLDGVAPIRRSTYWLWIVDGKLSQWGRAGDWKREADRIYEVRWR